MKCCGEWNGEHYQDIIAVFHMNYRVKIIIGLPFIQAFRKLEILTFILPGLGELFYPESLGF